MESDISHPKKTKMIDYDHCVICQVHNHKYSLVHPKDEKSLANLVKKIKDRQEYGDSTYIETLHVLNALTISDFTKYNGRWHKECYKAVTNQSKIDRLKEKFKKLTSEPVANTSSEPRTKRNANFTKHQCVLCQEEKDQPLHEVSSVSLTNKLKEIARNTTDEVR